MTLILTPLYWFLDIFDRQRGRLFLWLPVLLGIGVSLYFATPLEPDLATFIYVATFAAFVAAFFFFLPAYLAPPF
ncbi:MAG: hypothetical protein ABF285_08195 [Pacificibacter sp.]